MKHRPHNREGYAIRTVTMNNQVRSGREAALVFNLINTSLPRESGLFACISPRITMVIQVVREYNQINNN